MRKIVFAIAVLVCAFAAGSAQTETVRPSVSVVGEAEMSVSPDQVVFTLEVITTDKEVAVAKQANDRASARTLVAAKGFNIAADDIQTDSLTISPRYSGEKDPRGNHVLIGYEVTKRVLITLKDLNKIDDFLAKVIEAGVNRVSGISIENSQFQKHQETVRAMAVANARAKAVAYAKQLNQTIGKAYVIREEGGDFPGYTQGVGYGSGDGAGSGEGDPPDLETPTAYAREITFAFGKIKVEEKIYVTFELNRQ
jgi:uncharacterized protein